MTFLAVVIYFLKWLLVIAVTIVALICIRVSMYLIQKGASYLSPWLQRRFLNHYPERKPTCPYCETPLDPDDQTCQYALCNGAGKDHLAHVSQPLRNLRQDDGIGLTDQQAEAMYPWLKERRRLLRSRR